MSGFHQATICADCDPPVVAISTGNGSRCPKCGQVKTWPATAVFDDARPDGALARQILRATAVRSDVDAHLLRKLAERLLDHVGRAADKTDATECPHCAANAPSVWDDVLFHYAHPGYGDMLKFCHSPWRARCLRCSADVGACNHEVPQ